MTDLIRSARWPALFLFVTLAGCSAGEGSDHRVGDVYERNNMPSLDADHPAGPHSLNTDDTGDHAMLRQDR